MIYAYIRVSTDKQTLENQQFEINNFVARNNIKISKWVMEKISGLEDFKKRRIGDLLERAKKDDIIIASEISRFGRNILQIMAMLNICANKGIKIWTIKDNYRLDENIQSKILAFAFGLSAEIERNLLSQRTKEALHRAKAEGILLGRPKGLITKQFAIFLSKRLSIIRMMDLNISIVDISKITGIKRSSLYRYLHLYDKYSFPIKQ